ncbi:MAG TPA: DegT/DnrJ/EryC1/StrS family aminotransferase, partial [Vicinamibacterales bacterium]|nr:DegT/DnrJ/EryC1/StrS family aminotransferase [Vicinamibacterales bacterium]
DLDPILSWARRNNLRVIEDASQALGLSYGGKPCGSFGDVSVFSLYANKAVTTGEGGMIVCDSTAFADKCRSLRNLCFDPAKRFWHEELGWNYRMTALQAALGLSQFSRLPEIVARKRAIGRIYHDAFKHEKAFAVAPAAAPYAENVYWVFGLVVDPRAPFSRQDLAAALDQEKIGTRTFFHGLHQQPALLANGYMEACSLPITQSLSERGLYLPSGLGLSTQDQQRVIEVVSAFVSARS